MEAKNRIVSDIDIIIEEAKKEEPSYHRIIYFAKTAKWTVLNYDTLCGVTKSIDWANPAFWFSMGYLLNAVLHKYVL